MGICSNCGAQLPEGATFCQACGTAVPTNTGSANVQQAYTTQESEIVGKVKAYFDKTKLTILGVAVLVLIVAAFICSATGKASYKASGAHTRVVKSYVKALSKKDAAAVIKCIDKDFIEEKDIEKSDVKDNLRKNQYIGMKGGIDVIGSDPLSKDEIEDLESSYSYYDYDVNIKEAYTVYFTYKDDDKDIQCDSVEVVKVGSKWYIEPSTFYYSYGN